MRTHEDLRLVNGGIYGRSLYGAKHRGQPTLAPWKPVPHSELPSIAQEKLLQLYALILAQHRNLWATHNQVQGPSFYGDHLLFQRLYEDMNDEIDKVAERMVGYLGTASVNNGPAVQLMLQWIDLWNSEEDPVQRALLAERTLQAGLRDTYDTLKEAGVLTLGLDDLLMGIANDHDVHLYLLQQRAAS